MPHITMKAFWVHGTDCLLITERVKASVKTA